MDVHVFRSQVLDTVPRSPAELRQTVQHAVLVLDQEPRMRWACLALVLAGVALAFSRRPATTVAAALAVAGTGSVWLRVSQIREGDILVGLAPDHGITEADLLVPLVVTLATSSWVLGRVLRRRRTSASGPAEPAQPVRQPQA